MNARDLIRNEAEEPEAQPGLPPGAGRRMRPPGGPRPSGGPHRFPPGHGPEDFEGMPGGPPQQFSRQENVLLQGIVIQMLAKMMGSTLDAEIGTALAQGQELSPGQLQHIFDEARSLPLPKPMEAVMGKLHQMLSKT